MKYLLITCIFVPAFLFAQHAEKTKKNNLGLYISANGSYNSKYNINNVLVDDDVENAQKAAQKTKENLAKVDMKNTNGASWLSLERKIKNPYFGEAMLKCGEIIHTLD